MPRMLRLEEVLEIAPYSRMHLYNLEKEGKFPKRIKIGDGQSGRIVWNAEEVEDWLASKMAAA